MKQPLLLDGAMGAELLCRGADIGDCLELLNLTAPEKVLSVHRSFRAAGAQLLTTHTFGANRLRLAEHGLETRVAEINAAAVALARTAAEGAMVVGSIGPTAVPIGPDIQAAFREQAAALDAAGVDAFTCETFGDPDELQAAVSGIREVSSKPVWAQVYLLLTGLTRSGHTPAAIAQMLTGPDVQAIGINCTTWRLIASALEAMRRVTPLPLIARPNAGSPSRGADESLTYPIDAEQFAAALTSLAGTADIVGGCCGAGPDHIGAAAQRLGVTTGL